MLQLVEPSAKDIGHAIESDAASLPAVRLVGISKTYAGTRSPAVVDLSVDIREGEIFALLGPSGCGKTTTLRIVAGLEAPDRGSIYFKERPIVAVSDRLYVPAEKREIGMVFQSYAIWPHMTVRENVAYPLRIRGVRAHEMDKRISDALELVGLQDFASRPTPMLSGGQQQRVALARALIYNPALLLLDEPFSNLDTNLREQMRLEVKLLQTRIKVTVLFVTHDQVEALSLADRMAVMSHGVVQQMGTPREIYERPVNAFVRDFLGKTIIFRGKVRSWNGQVAMVSLLGANNTTISAHSTNATEFRAGQDVSVALRPEEASLVSSASELSCHHPAALPGIVEAAMYAGANTQYRVKVSDQGHVVLYGGRSRIFAPGHSVLVGLPFDVATVWPLTPSDAV